MITEKLKLICKKILDLSNNKISNVSLQKLLYFIQAYSLVDRDKPAFDDRIEAWQYGPVVPEAYNYIKYNLEELKIFKSAIDLDEATNKYINRIFEKLGNEEPFILIELTQTYDSWINTWKNSKLLIKNEDIKECHLKLLKETGYLL